jgi:hypothetical protein
LRGEGDPIFETQVEGRLMHEGLNVDANNILAPEMIFKEGLSDHWHQLIFGSILITGSKFNGSGYLK